MNPANSEPAPLDSTAAYRPIAEAPGAVIGAYKLLQKIGEGGFGAVFMAEQHEPIRRTVALKIIKPGMDTAQVIARFESERQALALMEHPNIAKVLDAGATESGRPFFVMELVKGVPITKFCDKHHLPPEARLKLFIDVCHAIQHAHHKGIIHRDIKPSNVMVTLHDGVAVVKVIDFGVAKATVQKLTEKTLFTAYGQMIGTPAYMSPEQAEMSVLDIDTRSDVYSLGVLLYELLTGTTPLQSKRLREAGYAEMQRMICEEEAPRPSTRLSSLLTGQGASAPGVSVETLAGNRGLDVKRLVQLLAGDLDWVVMKALEKDRNRRYGTPGNFAEDLERYLRREAILARPPSTAYRLKKFAQRNRAAVLTTAVVAAALLIGTAIAIWQAIQATQAQTAALKALDEKEKARAAEASERERATNSEQKALEAAAAEKEAKESAEQREAEITAVLDFVENKVFAAARPARQGGGLGGDVSLRKAIETALPFVDKSFTKQPLIEARLRLTLGKSYFYLGEWKKSAEQEEAARALFTQHRGPDHPDTLMSMNNLSNSYYVQGRHDDALKLREVTLTLRTAKLGPKHPDTLRSMNNLGISFTDAKRHGEAMTLLEKTRALLIAVLGHDQIDTLRSAGNLALSYFRNERPDDAIKLLEETLGLQRLTLGSDHPDTLMSMGNLAAFYLNVDRTGDGVKLLEETLTLKKKTLGPDHPSTLNTVGNLAAGYNDLGRSADAAKLFEETLALLRVNPGISHPDTLRTMKNLAHVYVRLGRGAEAVRLVDECVPRALGKVVSEDLVPEMMNVRLRHFEKSRDAAGCRATAEMWEKLKRTDPGSLYDAARMRAVAAALLRTAFKSPAGAKLALAEADRAMAWLQQAVAAGYKDAAHMAKDQDLDAVRDRPDFKKLLAELAARK